MAEYLQQVKVYAQKLPVAVRQTLLKDKGQKLYTKFGQQLEQDVREVCG